MKKVGLIGGMSWESSLLYYRRLNEEVRDRLGGHSSAECILYSVDFARIEQWQREDKWDTAGQYLAQVTQKLESSGADGIVLCTNTMHKVAAYIESASSLPFIHITDVTTKAIKTNGHKKLLLLGTKYTMEQPFIKDHLETEGLLVHIPNEVDRVEINRIIFNELCLGEISGDSKKYLNKLVRNQQDIEGVILGCTELGLLVSQDNCPVEVYDTTELHVNAAVKFIFS